MNKKQLFDEFKTITGCTNQREIEQYLVACSYDLATAVDVFFARDPASENNPARPDVAMVSDDEDEIQFVQSTSKVQPTRKTRSAAKNGNSAGSSKHVPSFSSSSNNQMEPEVRAPIEGTRGPIVHQSFNQQYGTRSRQPRSAFNQEVRDFRQEAVDQERNMRLMQNGINYDLGDAAYNGDQENDNRGSKQPTSLQTLFRPPIDIMFNGNWENAKAMASRAEKWLMVNIQNVQEFPCQTLNRDVWANSGVKELVKTNFLFWQILHDTTDGERLRNYYHVKSYPSIFIVDPRTGELVHNILLKRQDPVTFCDSVATFLDQFPDLASRDRLLTGDSLMAGAQMDEFGPGIGAEIAAEPECSRSAVSSAMDEDMPERPTRKRKNGIDAEVLDKRSRMDAHNGDDPYVEDSLNHDTRSLSVVDKDDWLKEVSPHGERIRIKMRFPDGRSSTVDITDDSKLKALIRYITGQGISGHDHMFVLSFPRREYSIDHAEYSLKTLGFSKNEVVHVELK